MELQMTNELQDLIKKNLPSLAAGELSKVLVDYKIFKDQVAKDKDIILNLEKKLTTANSQLDVHKENAKNVRCMEYDLKSLLIENKKTLESLKVDKLTHELKCANQAKQDIYHLTEILYKNPRIISRATSSSNRDYYDTTNTFKQEQTQSSTDTEHIEEQE